MKWSWEAIWQSLMTGGLFTLIAGYIASKMDWIRFKPKDKADVGKVEAETDLIRADAADKRAITEIKLSDATLVLLTTVGKQLDKANMIIEAKEKENERLTHIIVTLKEDFERDIEQLKEDFDKRINELKIELEHSRQTLVDDRNEYLKQIEELKKLVKDNDRK